MNRKETEELEDAKLNLPQVIMLIALTILLGYFIVHRKAKHSAEKKHYSESQKHQLEKQVEIENVTWGQ